ncbi:intermembrane phospholipid transport protein YdbH family protein [Microbulbifer magnicolonia]|uniref:intermembrane phospholipid transport protein YdbH family protein n=1 Tax=Microbulbifer magnicolonia TaxID=3109744 RepID=UPI002B4144BA|nr:YdbH domain-containing protein [Microbulbifer sp. GG15]
MRKSRLILVTAVLLVLAACYWAWRDRDRVALTLINPLLKGSSIEQLQGLQIGVGRVSIERLNIGLDSNAELQLENVRLLNPVSLLWAGSRNRAQLTIDKLRYTPRPIAVSTIPQPDHSDVPPARDLKLSEMVEPLYRYLPEKLQIAELRWGKEATQIGTLNLRRDSEQHSVHADFSSGGQRLSVLVRAPEGRARFVAHLGTEGQDPALSLTGELTPGDSGTWRGTAKLESDLQQVTDLPLSENLNDIAASASGKLAASIEMLVPDRVLQLQDYRHVSARLQSESLYLTLPAQLLGAAIQLSLSTRDPVVVKLARLQPLQPEAISGSATLKLTPTKQQAPAKAQAPMLELQVDSGTEQGRNSLTVTGSLHLDRARAVLQAPRWQQKLAPFSIDSPDGSVLFRGNASLKPPGDIRNSERQWLSDINLSFLPESRISLDVARAETQGSQPAQMGWQKGKVQLQLEEVLTLRIDQWPGDIQVAGGPVVLGALSDSGDINLDSQLQQIACTIARSTSCSMTLEISSEKITQPAINLVVHKPAIHTQVNVMLEGSRQRLQLQDMELSAAKIVRDETTAENTLLVSPQAECTLADGEPVCIAQQLTATLSILKTGELTASGSMKFGDVQFNRANRQPQLSSRFRSENFKLQIQGGYQLEPQLTGTLSLNGDLLRGDGQILAGPLQMQSQWHHNLDSAEGSTEFTLSEAAFSQRQPLSQSVTGLPMDIVAGTVSAKGHLSWPPTQRDFANLELADVALVFGDSFATGVKGQFALQRPGKHWQTVKPQPVQIDTLDVGLPVENIHFLLSLDENQDVKLGNLSAELLDGRLESQALVWNLVGAERRSQVSVSGISLRELTREMETENFAASGILDLQIPLITSAEGATVKQGTIEARPPGGRLRYYGAFSAEVLSNNPQLKLIAGALEDYNYRELSGTLEYPPSGDMQLQLKLVGRSASVDANRDLIINLNLENNIPAMLRSLQASRDLTEALEKQIQ